MRLRADGRQPLPWDYFRVARDPLRTADEKCSIGSASQQACRAFRDCKPIRRSAPQSFALLPSAAQGLIELHQRCEFVASRLREL
jgi:hypothetical protein